jgi:hypothetical protein
MARQNKEESLEAERFWGSIKMKDKRPKLRLAAKELMSKAGIEEGTPCGIAELKKFQVHLIYDLLQL